MRRRRPIPADPSEWGAKGATLSDKTASREYGLTREEVVQAIRDGKLEYRMAAMHGNPFLRLLRRQVEALVRGQRGGHYLEDRRTKTAVGRIDGEIRSLKRRIAALKAQRSALLEDAGRTRPPAPGGGRGGRD